MKLLLIIAICFLIISIATAKSGDNSEENDDDDDDDILKLDQTPKTPKNFTGLKDGGCYMTKCSSGYAFCAYGYQNVMEEQHAGRECNHGQSRKLCCKPLSVNCEDTPCRAHHVQCPSGRDEINRDTIICGSKQPTLTTLLCCNSEWKPPCFNTSCSSSGSVCPKGYEAADSGSGESWGCPNSRTTDWTYKKTTCCLTSKSEESDSGAGRPVMQIGVVGLIWMTVISVEKCTVKLGVVSG